MMKPSAEDEAQARKVLKERGFSPGPLLGAGLGGGIVFEDTAAIRRAVKITDDYCEATFCRWLNALGSVPPGLPCIYDVAELGVPYRYDEIVGASDLSFAIVREQLDDVPISEPQFYCAIQKLEEGLEQPAAWQRLRGCAREEASSLVRDRHYFDAILPTFDWLYSQKARVWSLHEGNFGLRGSDIVIRDLGHACKPKNSNVNIRVA